MPDTGGIWPPLPSGHLGLSWPAKALGLWVEELGKPLRGPPDLLPMICSPDICLCVKNEINHRGFPPRAWGMRAVLTLRQGWAIQAGAAGERLSFSELCTGGRGGSDGCCLAMVGSWRALGRSPGHSPHPSQLPHLLQVLFAGVFLIPHGHSHPSRSAHSFAQHPSQRIAQAHSIRKGRTLFLLPQERGVSVQLRSLPKR